MNEAHKKGILNEILKNHEPLRRSKYWMQGKNSRNLIFAFTRSTRIKSQSVASATKCFITTSFAGICCLIYEINSLRGKVVDGLIY